MRDYMCAVWNDPIDKPKMFTAWWVDAETRGLCYSFELVTPRILGDHGATPEAAYLVLTTVALTSGKSSRFLSPAEVIELATRWRLPLNEVWYFPSESAVAVEKALHQARWTLKDSQVQDVLAKVGGSSMVRQSFLTHLETQGEVLEGFVLMALEVASMDKLTEYVKAYNNEMAPCHDRVLKAALALGKRCKDRDPSLEKLITSEPNGGVEIMLNETTCIRAPEPTVIGTTGEVLWEAVCRPEGDVGGLFRRLRDSYKHRATLKAYKYSLIGAMVTSATALAPPSANVVKVSAPQTTGSSASSNSSASVRGVAVAVAAVCDGVTATQSATPDVPFFDGKCRRCWKKGHKAMDCPKNKKKSATPATPPASSATENAASTEMSAESALPPTPPSTMRSESATSTASVASSTVSSVASSISEGNSVLQVQIDIHDDNVFYSWPLHVASGGCASLYRGLVIQFDPHTGNNSAAAGGGGGGGKKKRYYSNKKRPAEAAQASELMVSSGESETEVDIAESVGIESRIEMRILGIEKLKCLNYIWRTFGVRNQLTCLLSQGPPAYLRRCKTGFFKNWSVPPEYHAGMMGLFEGWANHISSLSKKEKEKAFSRETYLDILEEYLTSGSALAQRAAHIVSGVSHTAAVQVGGKKKHEAAAAVASPPTSPGASTNGSDIASLMSKFYVVVANLTNQEIPFEKFGLHKANMITDKPNEFTTNKWLHVQNNIPLPWMFEGGSKASRQKGRNNKAAVKDNDSATVPQIAIVFGPPPIFTRQPDKQTRDNSGGASEAEVEVVDGTEDPRWKHIVDGGNAGWASKNKNIPLFINPGDDLPK
jgi:hypothetical protein